MLASMGWQVGQGLGKAEGGRVEPVLPQFKWDKAGLGSSTNVKRLRPQTTTFRRATAAATTAANGAGASAAAPAALAAAVAPPVACGPAATSAEA